jgi:YjbE family integral membrane protein
VNWIAANAARLFEIAGLNVLLSGDNAVVVAMAVRNLTAAQRRMVSAAGIWTAVLVQIVATLTVARLLALPMVSLAGGFLLCAIAIRLQRQNGSAAPPVISVHRAHSLLRSTVIVIAAYFAMCLDNILALAAVGRGHHWILIIGILLSSAVIIPASLAIANLMKRYPVMFTIGAAIVGWVSGSMLATFSRHHHLLSGRTAQFMIPAVVTAIVITSPLWLRYRQEYSAGPFHR